MCAPTTLTEPRLCYTVVGLKCDPRRENPMTTVLSVALGWGYIAAAFYVLARWGYISE